MEDIEAGLKELGLRKIGLEPLHFIPLEDLGLYQKLTAFRGFESPVVVSLGVYEPRDFQHLDGVSEEYMESIGMRKIVPFDLRTNREKIKGMLRELDEDGYGVLEVFHRGGWAVFFSSPENGNSFCYENIPEDTVRRYRQIVHADLGVDRKGMPHYKTVSLFPSYPNEIRLTLGEKDNGKASLMVFSLNTRGLSGGHKIYRKMDVPGNPGRADDLVYGPPYVRKMF